MRIWIINYSLRLISGQFIKTLYFQKIIYFFKRNFHELFDYVEIFPEFQIYFSEIFNIELTRKSSFHKIFGN